MRKKATSVAKKLIIIGKKYRYDPDFLPGQCDDLYRMQEAQKNSSN